MSSLAPLFPVLIPGLFLACLCLPYCQLRQMSCITRLCSTADLPKEKTREVVMEKGLFLSRLTQRYYWTHLFWRAVPLRGRMTKQQAAKVNKCLKEAFPLKPVYLCDTTVIKKIHGVTHGKASFLLSQWVCEVTGEGLHRCKSREMAKLRKESVWHAMHKTGDAHLTTWTHLTSEPCLWN